MWSKSGGRGGIGGGDFDILDGDDGNGIISPGSGISMLNCNNATVTGV